MMNPARFMRQVRYEVSKVTWPSRKELLGALTMVLILTAMAAVYFLIVDMGVSHLIKTILGIGA
jgi:preprotein translocase subunit SecE